MLYTYGVLVSSLKGLHKVNRGLYSCKAGAGEIAFGIRLQECDCYFAHCFARYSPPENCLILHTHHQIPVVLLYRI